MPTRNQTSKRPAGGRFARAGGKTTQRQAAGRRGAPSRRGMRVTRRKPQKSGAAQAFERITAMLPGARGQKQGRGAGGGRGKKRPAGLALLAGAAGLAMKNRQKLTSMVRRKQASSQPTT